MDSQIRASGTLVSSASECCEWLTNKSRQYFAAVGNFFRWTVVQEEIQRPRLLGENVICTDEDDEWSLSKEQWQLPGKTQCRYRKCAKTDNGKWIIDSEKALLIKAQGPNVIELLESNDDSIYMVDGGQTLHAYVKENGALDFDNFIFVAEQLMQGLAHLKKNGVRHQDIKPDNITIDEQGRLSIIDFGLAELSSNTTYYEVCSKGYKTPEMYAVGQNQVSWKTDVYSAGVTLYEAFTGERLFPESVPNDVFRNEAKYLKFLKKKLKKVRVKNSAVEPILEAVLDWNPKTRWSAECALESIKELKRKAIPSNSLPFLFEKTANRDSPKDHHTACQRSQGGYF